MPRRHGWQLPAHSLQVIAITVFFFLSIAFYVFLAPFLGKDLYEHMAIGVYSFLVLSVFVLYVRCTAIDPADPGILITPHESSAYKSTNKAGDWHQAVPAETMLKAEEMSAEYKSVYYAGMWGFCCGFVVKEDCRRDEDISQQHGNTEEALFCTLCNAEVHRFSKHCRSCDKCVDGFDHHCRWLNNCIGRKNYITFLSLMAMSLVWLLVECGIGIAVLVRCFTGKKAVEIQMIERLGNGFSLAPFATVVALCTSVSLLACLPLGELLLFHILLIKKGITTYEYVVAMRAQNEAPGPSVHGSQQSMPSSPNSSIATGMSGGSSLGLQYRAAWCTPPRVFVDQQDEIVPHLEPGRVPSTVDPDVSGTSDRGEKVPKRPVRISAWNLAKLDSSEALRAAAKARASSSVLRPISSHPQHDTDLCSSGNISSRSSNISMDVLHRDTRSATLKPSPLKSSYPPSRTSREDLETSPQTLSSFSSPRHATKLGSSSTLDQHHYDAEHFNPVYQSSAIRFPLSMRMNDDDSMASDDVEHESVRKTSSCMVESPRPPIYWDQGAGRFMSLRSTPGISHVDGTTLLYTRQSIFHGGPLLTDGTTRISGAAGPTNLRQGGADSRRGSRQLPVFVPRYS
uniref:S-acyltransferase n=1 Tax=Anthurium amnicola TaxID=1678845 RepID=A0A1D1YVQ3_9ARAE